MPAELKALRSLKLLFAVGALASSVVAQSSKRPITVEDCVRTRRVFEGQVAISFNGAAVAYVVEAPNIETNKNEYRLYVRDLSHAERQENGRVLLEADSPIGGMRWVNQGTKLAIVLQVEGKSSIQLIDAASGQEQTVAATSDPIVSFSSDAMGSTFVYTTSTIRTDPEQEKQAKEEAERGYPVIFGHGTEPFVPGGDSADGESSLFLVKRTKENEFAATKLFADAQQRPRNMPPLVALDGLSLSPNGRYLTFNYQMEEIPEAWQTNPYASWLHTMGVTDRQIALGLYDFERREFKVPFDCAGAGWGLPVVWASDSQAFTILALSPVNSAWEKRDKQLGFVDMPQFESFTHLFAVDLSTGTISEVLEKLVDWLRNPTLSWKRSNDTMLVLKSQETLSWLRREGTEWTPTGISHLSLGSDAELQTHVSSLAPSQLSDGIRVVGSVERPSVPPEVFVHNVKEDRTKLFTDLNPEYHDITLGEIERVEWQDRLGVHCTGLLIKPVGYEPNKKYPLVIMTKGWGNDFLSDTGFHTAFPPQPLANAGFLVLMASVPPHTDLGPWKRSLQKEPGKMAEAFEFISFVESAVDMLERRGMAGRASVGIIGFSRTSWQTDFMLTHSTFPFAAASSADSELYTYGSYWQLNSDGLQRDSEDLMGGAPYGSTFENWLRFAPPFNAGSVRTPLLMEYMSTKQYPENGLEFFTALKRQNKPAELFHYPTGEHVLDTPYERVASLQRNVDWFRFWMQGLDGKAPDYDPDQYVRWRKLREQQQWNDRIRAEGKDPVSESLRQSAPGGIVPDAERAPTTELNH